MKLTGNYPPYVQGYLDQVPENDLFDAFRKQRIVIELLLKSITEEKSCYAYAEGKWTIKELLQHCIDAERIFSYRALTFARKDAVNLPGFDEDFYAANSLANERDWSSIVKEFLAVRQSTELLFYSFSTTALLSEGTVNNHQSSVVSIGFLCVGHLYHHIAVIKSKYLV